MYKKTLNSAFTIVELIIVITVIAIISAASILSYGKWQSTTIAAQLQSDLNGALGAMEDYRTFNDQYPTSVPTSFKASKDVTISGGSSDGAVFCIDASSSRVSTLHYYIDQTIGQKGAQTGTCAARPVTPSAPATIAATATSSTAINVSWGAISGATSYSLQRATNSSFTNAVTITTQAGLTFSSSSLTANTAYYYRVLASNSIGSSSWSISASATTLPECNGVNQYGTYPNCYAYDSLPVGSSISGYYSTVPTGYLLEDGSAVSRTTYADLFSAIGTTYGAGNGTTTFNLPDSRGRITVNLSSADSEFDTIGEKYGEKTHLWTIPELPNHSHGQVVTANPNSGGTGYRIDYGADGAGSGVYSQGVTTGSSGGGGTHNEIQPSIVKLFAIKFQKPSVTVSYTVPAGTSVDGYWTAAPDGYLVEDGSAISRSAYSDLFAVIGTTYGAGNGTTTFNLPDSRGRTAVGLNPTDSEFNSIGEQYGEKTHTVTIAEMPLHFHAENVTANPNSGGTGIRTDFKSDVTGAISYAQGIDTGLTGGGGAHNNIQPSIVKLSVIKYTAQISLDAVNKTKPGQSISGYWTAAPNGYLLEDGSAVSRTTYANLFTAIGTTYGVGDGSTTFNLPDSRGRAVANKSTDTEFDVIGEKYGEKTHVLTVAEMPNHGHPQNVTANPGSGGTGVRVDFIADVTGAGVFPQGANTNNKGNDAAHNNIQPSIVKMFAIQY